MATHRLINNNCFDRLLDAYNDSIETIANRSFSRVQHLKIKYTDGALKKIAKVALAVISLVATIPAMCLNTIWTTCKSICPVRANDADLDLDIAPELGNFVAAE